MEKITKEEEKKFVGNILLYASGCFFMGLLGGFVLAFIYAVVKILI